MVMTAVVLVLSFIAMLCGAVALVCCIAARDDRP